MIVSVALMSFDLGSLCWVTFSEESTDCGKTSRLVKAHNTRSLNKRYCKLKQSNRVAFK